MINKVILLGRLGKDPQESGSRLTLSLATTKRGYVKDGVQIPERTEWHNVVLFGALADVAKRYLHKGSLVYIEGELNTYTYERAGETKYYTSVTASVMEMIGGKRTNQPQSSEHEDDEVPF